MPRESRLVQDLLAAIHDNNLRQTKDLLEPRVRKKDIKFSLLCLNDTTCSLSRDLGGVVLAACRLKDPAILEYLLDKGASVNFVGESAAGVRPAQLSPLHVAVSNGLPETTALLLQKNADVNRRDHHGRTPLHLAVKKCDCEITRLLLSRGADVNATDGQQQTPLQLAAKFGHVELVRLLLEFQAHVFCAAQKGPSPLHLAAMHGHLPLVDIFTHCVDINILVPCADGVKKAPLHLAAERGHLETVRFILERLGADANRLDGRDQTALHCVLVRPHDHTRMRRKEDFDMTLELLLQNSMAVNHQNKDGDTALHLAARHQFYKAVEMLLIGNADPTTKNKKQMTPRDCIPDHDLAMKQLFAKYNVFSAPYVTRVCHVRDTTSSCPCSPTSSTRIPVTSTGFSQVSVLKSDIPFQPSAPAFDWSSRL